MRSATRVKESKTAARHWVARVIGSLVAVAGLGLLAAAPAFAAAATITVNVFSDTKPIDHSEGVAYDGTNGHPAFPIATFIDSDACPTPLTCQPNSAFTATVRWGDNSTNTACAPPYPAAGCDIVLIDSATGTYQITASHTYKDEFNCQPAPCLNYPVHVSVTDTVDAITGTGSNIAGNGIAVKDQVLTGAPITFNATSGVSFSGPIGSFQDANPLSAIQDQGGTPEYSLSIDWGDGTAVDNSGTLTLGACAPGGCQVSAGGTHTYMNSNMYPVTITVQDGLDTQFKITFTSTANVANDGGSKCTSANLLGASSPVTTGTSLSLSAGAGGCSAPKFQFWLQYPAGPGPWVIKQPFSSGLSTYTWNTTGLIPGQYRWVVWANQAGNSTSNFEAYASAYVTLTGCGPVSITWNPTSPQPSGTNPILLTATTSVCANARYQFWVRANGSSTWTDVQPYSGNNVLTWNTTGVPANTYYFSVWVKDLNSGGTSGNSLGRWDNYVATSYMLTSKACTSVTVASSPPGPSPVGTPVTITGSAVTCTFPLYEFWILAPGSSTWKLAQAYSTSPNYNWATTGLAAGTYKFSVWARDSGSTGTAGNTLGRWDTYSAYSYTLT